MLWRWFFSPDREIRRVNRAVPEVIEYANQCFGKETVRAIAEATGEHMDRAHRIFEPTPIGAKRAIVEYKRLHNEARKQRDDVSLTAFTLVMLYIRAELQGEHCQPARDTIEALVVEWVPDYEIGWERD